MLLWWLAFFQSPTAAATKDWLARLQVVCFGSMENGLPNGGGWILLIAAPLSFVAALIVMSGTDLKSELQRSRKILFALLLLVGWETVWVGTRIKAALEISQANFSPTFNGELPETYPRGTIAAPDFSLVNQNGETVSLTALRGKTVLLTFAFAHCRTICPALIETGRAALDKLPAEQTVLLIITLDPQRDTPGALPELAKHWQLPKNAFALSGAPDAVEQTIKHFNMLAARNQANGDITHAAMFYLVSPDGILAYTFTNPSPDWLVQAAGRLQQHN